MGPPEPSSAAGASDEVAAYLESCARSFDLPMRTGVQAERPSGVGDGFEVDRGKEEVVWMAAMKRQ